MADTHEDPIGANAPELEPQSLIRVRIKAEFLCDLTQREISFYVRRLEGPMSQMTATNGLVVAPLEQLPRLFEYYLEVQRGMLEQRVPPF